MKPFAGRLRVVYDERMPKSEPLHHTVAFRLTASDRARLEAFVESFPDKTYGEAFRWLLSEPTVTAVMARHIEESLVPAAT